MLDVNPHLDRALKGVNAQCDIFRGKWMPHDGGTYYTNSSCPIITDQLNCFKFGRPNSEFLKWRWMPDGCELPLFNATKYLEFVQGKSMAFVGDGTKCTRFNVDYPEDISDQYKRDPSFPRWHFPRYNFTIAALFAPFLVKATTKDSFLTGTSTADLHLDEPEASWASQIEEFDIVIISAGHWLFSPKLIFHKKGQILGCSSKSCNTPDITPLFRSRGIRKVFRTNFETLMRKTNYRGLTFLRTFPPQHFENGGWDSGGTCVRTQPIAAREASLWAQEAKLHTIQVGEFREAELVASKRGLKFMLLDTTGMMQMRPDGHPNFYGRSPHEKVNRADCVHWCLPGPIDTWNELLLYLLVAEGKDSF